MNPIDPPVEDRPDLTVRFAENQDEYRTLPAVPLEDGSVYSRWSLDDVERGLVAAGASIELWVSVGKGNPMVPVLLRVEPNLSRVPKLTDA